MFAIDCSTYVSINGKIKIYINNGLFKIILLPSEETLRIQSDTDNKLLGEVVFVSKDIAYQNNVLIVNDQTKKYYFKKFNSDIFVALSNMSKYIKKGDKFYCSNYRFPDNSVLSGHTWKENKKDGEWIYIKGGESFIYTFKNGIIIHKRRINR